MSEARAFAVLDDGEWSDAQPSALAFLAGDADEFADQWPRAGGVRATTAHHRRPGAPKNARAMGAEHVWPTPRARDRQPVGATEWELTERPVRMDLLHVRVARLRPDLWIPDESLTVAERTPVLNPLFVELLMGFSAGWTEVASGG